MGGMKHDDETLTDKVYRYKPESQEWEEFLQPMPTARDFLTVISTQSALIACGGCTENRTDKPPCSTVEVYTVETSQWHTSDPLPVPVYMISSTTINNTAYLLGGLTMDPNIQPSQAVMYASIDSLIQIAISQSQQSAGPDSTSSAWKTLRDTPRNESAAASLGGTLLAVGGRNDDNEALPAVHLHCSTTNTWIRVESGDLPQPQYGCAAVELPGNRLLVIGGYHDTDSAAMKLYCYKVFQIDMYI